MSRVSADQILSRGRRQAEGPGVEHVVVPRAVGDHPHPRGRRGRELVEAVATVEDHAAAPPAGEYARHQPGHALVGDADGLPDRTCGVRQRPEEVEHGRDAELATSGRRMPEGLVVQGCEQEHDPCTFQHRGLRRRRYVEAHTQRLQHVGGAAR